MRLPRRVPWVSIAELDQVCAWIYTDERDIETNVLAINRLSAWRAIAPLPHALESTLALLAVIQQDNSPSISSFNHLSLRHSYAAAIIRFVNGLVDPLQLGAYARSIASIAAQLGLPAWLVELRHAATHEDLPSLELLREAARQSMSWLLHNYFLPIVNPAASSRREAPPLRPLEPVLRQYKAVMKIITRDASLRTKYKEEVNAMMRDIERWIAEAKVAANIVVGEVGWESNEISLESIKEGSDNIDPKEKWALEQFCDVLTEKGVLVPLSKKKRTFPVDKFWPPQLSLSLWTPLLKHLQILHANFAGVLCASILTTLFPVEAPNTTLPPTNTEVAQLEAKSDPSYEICLARWVMWSLDTWSTADGQNNTTADLSKDVASSLIQALGRELGDSRFKNDKAAKALLQAICSQNPTYKVAMEFLLKPSNRFVPKNWTDQDLTTMKDRLAQLLPSTPRHINQPSTSERTISLMSTSVPDGCSAVVDNDRNGDLPSGWRRVGVGEWKACPIGVFYRV